MGHLVNTAAIGSGKGLQFLTVCRALREVLRKVCQFAEARHVMKKAIFYPKKEGAVCTGPSPFAVYL